MQTASTPPWTTRTLLKWLVDTFADRGLDAPRVTAEMLLAHVLGCDRMRLYMEVDRPATGPERDELRALVRRVLDHEPVQYLIGEGCFYGRMFAVSPATLIPRPSTETIVEQGVRWARARADSTPTLQIADVGTGTGCIAITLAREIPGARVVATDIDPAILDLARANVARHAVSEQVVLREGSLLEPLLGESFDILCSNPPYIPDHEWDGDLVGPNVKGHEPERALRGGPDGLQFIRPLIEGVAEVLRPGGLLLLEIPSTQAAKVKALAEQHLADVCIIRDGDGLERVLCGHRC